MSLHERRPHHGPITSARAAGPFAASLLLALAASAAPPESHDIPLVPPSLEPGDRFGVAVALDGALAIVGAPGSDTFGADAGAVHVFREGVHVATLAPPPPSPDATLDAAAFGSSLALDGTRLLVGAAGADGGRGVAWELALQADGNWTPVARLEAPAALATAGFGRALDLDGDRALIGAPLSRPPEGFVGAVDAFERIDGQWIHRQRIVPPGLPGGALFGAAIALDGDVAVAGAPYLGLQILRGQAHVFRWDADTWTHEQALRASVSTGRDRFGSAVAVDRRRIAVGAPRDAPPAIGYVAIFRPARGGADGWEESGIDSGPAPEPLARHGVAVALAGNVLSVGANRAAVGGRVDVARVTGGGVRPLATHAPEEAMALDAFGTSLAASGHGLLVGSPGSADAAGAAWWIPRAVRGEIDEDG